MQTYAVLATVNEHEFQNAQELTAVWGDVRNDVESIGGDLVASYALLGSFDFLLLFEADDPEMALQIAIATERYGVDTHTMAAFPVEQLAEIVDDV